MDRLSGMEIFHWVVELGSFSRAADRLGLSKATVTTHIAGLEAHLRVRLLNRTTRRLALTEDGAAYLEHVRRVLADIEETEASLARGRSVPRGRLRVDMPVAIGALFIVPALPRFAAQYPELKVIATLNDHRSDLVAEGIDAAVRIGPLEDSSFIARKVSETSSMVVAAPDYLERAGEPRNPGELTKHNCIGLWNVVSGHISEWVFERDGERHTFTPSGSLAISNASALVDVAVAGHGIIRLAELAIGRELAAGALKPILPEWRAREPLPISVVYPQNRHLSAKVRAFVDFVGGLFPRAPR
jgi:LysR family transcriptional regulator, regulator for bpeEF and oprC